LLVFTSTFMPWSCLMVSAIRSSSSAAAWTRWSASASPSVSVPSESVASFRNWISLLSLVVASPTLK